MRVSSNELFSTLKDVEVSWIPRCVTFSQTGTDSMIVPKDGGAKQSTCVFLFPLKCTMATADFVGWKAVDHSLDHW